MVQTQLMRADEIAHAFNSVVERQYWRAAVAGSRLKPEVHFNSRASMVQVRYRIATDDFTIAFSKSAVAFGDYLASAARSLMQVLASLKAAGLPFSDVLDDHAVLRAEYSPRSKECTVYIARFGDDWLEVEPTPLKDPVRNNLPTPIDGL